MAAKKMDAAALPPSIGKPAVSAFGDRRNNAATAQLNFYYQRPKMSYGNPYSAPQTTSKLPVASEMYSPDLRFVADGFGYLMWTVRAMFLGLMLLFGFGMLGGMRVIQLSETITYLLVGGFYLTLIVLQMLAFLSFNKSPLETAARGISKFGMLMFLISIALMIGGIAAGMLRSPYPSMGMSILGGIFSVASSVALMVYFRAIAQYLQDTFATHITSALLNAMIALCIVGGLMLCIMLLTGFDAFGGNPRLNRGNRPNFEALLIAAVICQFFTGFLLIFVTVVYLVTIGGMRKLLLSKLLY